jgi:hypothetical protein
VRYFRLSVIPSASEGPRQHAQVKQADSSTNPRVWGSSPRKNPFRDNIVTTVVTTVARESSFAVSR